MNELMVQNLPELPFDINESINQLRVNLSFCGDQIKTIMITSSVPNEGKSFITMHLWKALAELGKRTLLIDCDLRNSELRTRYSISSQGKINGITHYLSGSAGLQDCIYSTNIGNGFMIPLTSPIANPTILLENSRFSTMLSRCADAFDYVLIDTPPVESVADALRIAAQVDGTVMVVRSGETSRKIVKDVISQLERTGTPLLGVVLSRVQTDRKQNYYYKRYYTRYYRSHYGYGKKE